MSSPVTKNVIEYAMTPDSQILLEIQLEQPDGSVKTTVELVGLNSLNLTYSSKATMISSYVESYAEQFFNSRGIGLYVVRRKNIIFG